MNTFAIGSLPVHFSVAKLFTFRWQYTLDQLIQQKYVERGEKEGSWRVFVTQVVFHRVCPEPNPRRNTMSVSLPDTLAYNRLIAKDLRNNGETCR